MRAAGSRRPRREGIKSTVGLIVEGDAEFLALPLLHRRGLAPGCPPMKAVNLHGIGSDRKPVGIAKMLAPKVIEHQVAGRSKVIVCLDREQRPDCSGDFAQSILCMLAEELQARGRSATGVHVVVADRTFEAWLLADAAGFHRRGVFQAAPVFHSFEGSMGKQSKKGIVELSHLLGRPYSKTSDGPLLFAELRLGDARIHGPGKRGSRSLDKLLRTLGV